MRYLGSRGEAYTRAQLGVSWEEDLWGLLSSCGQPDADHLRVQPEGNALRAWAHHVLCEQAPVLQQLKWGWC